MKAMKAYFKFSCVYCGQHIECERALTGRQMHCPSCKVPIVIPPHTDVRYLKLKPVTDFAWGANVPNPELDGPQPLSRSHAEANE